MKNINFKLLFIVFILFLLFDSCSLFKKINQNEIVTTRKEKYQFLKEFAVCSCVLSNDDNKSVASNDISPAIYNEVLYYAGTDTIVSLAKEFSKTIKGQTYQDYNNIKAIFRDCNAWANSKKMDSLFKNYAKLKNSTKKWKIVNE